tara:strand:+ start:145 stop:393 length:249 start_codon:yes stop_codon:yes gene_type:complete
MSNTEKTGGRDVNYWRRRMGLPDIEEGNVGAGTSGGNVGAGTSAPAEPTPEPEPEAPTSSGPIISDERDAEAARSGVDRDDK